VLLISATFIVVGAIVAGYETFDNNAIGYALIMGNNLATAFVNVIASVFNEKKLVNAFDLNFYFAIIGLPLSLAIITYNGELEQLKEIFFGNAAGEKDVTMITYICISGSFGILITMTALLCVTLNGPISMNITGIFKDLFLTIVGFVMFADTSVT
jgi:magnesium-transporting ATPase (P-type)